MRPRSIHRRCVVFEVRRRRRPGTDRHARQPGLADRGINGRPVGRRDPVAQDDRPPQRIGRHGVRRGSLLERRGGVPANRGIVIQQHQRHRIAQHLMRRKCQLRRHEPAQHRRQHRAGVSQRVNDLERRGHHVRARSSMKPCMVAIICSGGPVSSSDRKPASASAIWTSSEIGTRASVSAVHIMNQSSRGIVDSLASAISRSTKTRSMSFAQSHPRS